MKQQCRVNTMYSCASVAYFGGRQYALMRVTRRRKVVNARDYGAVDTRAPPPATPSYKRDPETHFAHAACTGGRLTERKRTK